MNRKFFYYALAIGGAQTFAFLALFVYTANLNPISYASVAIFESVLLLLQSTIGGAVDRGAQRFYLEEKPTKVISTTTTLAIALAVIFSPIVMFGSVFFSPISLAETSLIYIAALGYILNAILLVEYQFSDRPKYYFFASLGRSLIFFVSSVIFLYVFNIKEEAFLYSGLLTGGMLIIIVGIITKPHYRYLIDTKFIKDIMLYSLPFLPTLLASWVLAWSSRIFMFGNVSTTSIGVFSASQKVAMVFFLFTQALTLVATPTIFKLLKISDYDKVNEVILLNIKCLVIASLGLTFFLPGVFSFFADDSYGDIQSYILILMYVNFIAGTMGVSVNLLFNFYKKTYLQMKIFICAAVLSILLNWFLIREFNMIGVFVALLVPMLALLIINLYFTSKVIPFPLEIKKILLLLSGGTFLFLIYFLLISRDINTVYITVFEFMVMFGICIYAFRKYPFQRK